MRFARVKAEGQSFTTAFQEWSIVDTFCRPPATVPSEAEGFLTRQLEAFSGSDYLFGNFASCLSFQRPAREILRRSPLSRRIDHPCGLAEHIELCSAFGLLRKPSCASRILARRDSKTLWVAFEMIINR
jgi:hypothetical protein